MDLGLALELNSDLVPGADTNFPRIVADFFLEWGFGDVDSGTLVGISDLGSAMADGLQLVEFRDVGLDLGSFISDVLGPIVKEVQKVTEPLQPIIGRHHRADPGHLRPGRVAVHPAGPRAGVRGRPVQRGADPRDRGHHHDDQRHPRRRGQLGDHLRQLHRVRACRPVRRGRGRAHARPDQPRVRHQRRAGAAGSRTPTIDGFNFDSAMSSQAPPGSASAGFTSNLRNQDFGGGFSFPLLDDPSQIFGLLLGARGDVGCLRPAAADVRLHL